MPDFRRPQLDQFASRRDNAPGWATLLRGRSECRPASDGCEFHPVDASAVAGQPDDLMNRSPDGAVRDDEQRS